jgi:uroporphyrinogen decarboxylase
MSAPSRSSCSSRHLLVRACLGAPVERTPVWAMRQAGRWDPEFRRLRGDRPFYEFARDVEAAAEASLLPTRFGVDAVILFYDLTTLPQAYGWPFEFEAGSGPISRLVPARWSDLERLRQPPNQAELDHVFHILERVQQRLQGRLPVIAFAGAPFTAASYCVGTGKNLAATQAYAAQNPQLWHALLELLEQATVQFLKQLAAAGADVIQLFDTWAGHLSHEAYCQWASPFHQRIFKELCGVPTILYVRECPYLTEMCRSGAQAISLGVVHDLAAFRAAHPELTAQGNVSYRLLSEGTPEQVREATWRCLEQGGGHRHILNLSHGVPKDARVENFVTFVQTAHQWKAVDQRPTQTERPS